MRLLSLFQSARNDKASRQQPRHGRLGLEALEDRTLPANVVVVPISAAANNSNTFHTLQDALTAAGNNGTITIEPGAVADFNTDVTQSGLTIQGDPNVASSILPAYNLSIDASFVTLKNLNLNFVSVDAGFTNTTIFRSTVSSIFIQGGPSGNGNNVISQNQISSTVTITGNTNLGTASDDQILNNNFTGFGSPMLSVTADNGALIQGNTFIGGGDITTDSSGNNVTGAPQTAIAINGGVGVTVQNNNISLPGKANAAGVTGTFEGITIGAFDPTTAGLPKGTATAAPVVNVLNNTIATIDGTGLAIAAVATATGDQDTQVLVEGNDFHANNIGVSYTGNKGGTITTDLGGGSLGSKGGNNFRSFTSGGSVNIASIVLTNVAAGAVLHAELNMFANGATPSATTFAGAGSIDVSSSLSTSQAFVDALYNDFLHRSGTISELNGWVNVLKASGQAAVVQGIFLSPESLGNIVSNYYLQYLGRTADPAGKAYFVGLIEGGASLESVQAGFISSAEFISENDSDYVQGLYRTFFNRTGTSAELAYWYGQIQQPNGLNILANGFASSAENRGHFVQSFFTTYLHKTATSADISVYAGGSGSLLTIAAQLLGGTDFLNKG